MAKFLEGKTSGSALSDIVHLVLNVGFALVAVGLVVLTAVPWPSLLLVVASKWRTFIVRPYFLWLSIRANLVDIIANCSLVLLAWLNLENYIALLAITVLFVLWAAVIKTKNDLVSTKLQAGLSLFLGLSVAVQLCYELPNIVLVAAAGIIGYASARHFLIALDDDDTPIELSALCFGFATAAFAFASSFWQVVFVFGGVAIPALAISVLLVALFASLYLEYLQEESRTERTEVIFSGIFAAIIQIVILVVFSGGITY
ncbi:MAG: hypothetical protein LBM12_01490 [Candidatus Nomurabacteria bacterium]|jgi:hypothetical protein|nr:hypothetical protein [Candidatus Nomurabacteria bacterium]